ncbi:MAG: BatA domain-containing protein [Candidatus Tectomicrobia bacterium]|nr:BatA domain-containing protein [Candidatus Tectomicrobia bacterium]
MSLAFLNPLFLYGLAAASLPLLIHLINRRRAKPLRFPAVQFVLRANRRIARRYKLRQLLLMILRTLALLVLAAVMARPVLTEEGALLSGGGPPVALAVILDTSMSMGYRSGAGDRLDHARTLLDSYLAQLRGEDSVTLIPTARLEATGTRQAPQLVHDGRALQTAAADLRPTFGRADFRGSFMAAYEALAASAAPRKQILLLTDRQQAGWAEFDAASLGKVDPNVLIHILRLGGAQADENRTVERLALQSNVVGSDIPTVLEATLLNTSGTPHRRVLAQLLIDGVKVDQQLVDLPAGGRLPVRFEVAFEKPGRHAGVVQLSADKLQADDEYHFSLEVNDRIAVLVVDGDPRTSLVYSETYFLSYALNPGAAMSRSLIRPRVITASELEAAELGRYQVIVLANVPSLGEEQRQRLFRYVRDGGSLIFFLGTQTEAAVYNDTFYASTTRLLPVPLVERKQAPSGQPWHISTVEAAHPALRLFHDSLAGLLQRASFYSYMQTSSQALAGGGKALLALDNGDPYLVEGQIGAGKVLLFTSSADRDWNDFSTKTTYLPLMQNLVLYLSGAQANRLQDSLEVGDAKQIIAEGRYAGSEVTVTDPRGMPRLLRLQPQGSHAEAIFDANTLPGIYLISGAGKQQSYQVNVPLEESNLTEFPAARLRDKFQHLPVTISDVPEEQPEVAEPAAQRYDLWPYFFATLFGLLVMETIVAARF